VARPMAQKTGRYGSRICWGWNLLLTHALDREEKCVASHQMRKGLRPLSLPPDDIKQFQKAHLEWVEAGSSGEMARRDDRWSESIAVGSERFVERVKNELGFNAQHREVSVADGLYTLREPVAPYGDHFDRENEAPR
jgi:hypothetical protein